MNVLIVGLGSIGKKHVSAIRQLRPDANLYALRSGPHAEPVHGVTNVTSMLELPSAPDFVIISNPTHLHGDTIREALALRRPLFIEKPVLHTLENAESLREEIEAAGVLTYVACNLRFHPALQFLENYLRETAPRINEVNVYCGSYLPEWRPGADFRLNYSARNDMGGGVHLDLIHELDYTTWLLGFPGSVSATRRNVSSLGIDAPDTAHYHLDYPGFLATISLNYFRRDAKREIEIVTEDDTIVADLLRSRVSLKKAGTVIFESTFDIKQTYLDQAAYFMSRLNERSSMNDFGHGLHVLKLALHE